MTLRTLVLAAAVFVTTAASAQVGSPPPAGPAGRHPEAGGPLLRLYPPEVYKGFGQNWILLQDKRGVIYVGTTNGVLEYDGVTWRKILTPARATVRSLAADASGRIYAGAVSELGYLEADAKGVQSVLDQLEAEGEVVARGVEPLGQGFEILEIRHVNQSRICGHHGLLLSRRGTVDLR